MGKKKKRNYLRGEKKIYIDPIRKEPTKANYKWDHLMIEKGQNTTQQILHYSIML